MKPGRIPCINPRCGRTFKDDGDSNGEVICGKCFRALPEDTKKEHRRLWREIRKWERRITRTHDEMKIVRMRDIRDRFSMLLNAHWDRHIKAPLVAPDKPEGLETFLKEMGFE